MNVACPGQVFFHAVGNALNSLKPHAMHGVHSSVVTSTIVDEATDIPTLAAL